MSRHMESMTGCYACCDLHNRAQRHYILTKAEQFINFICADPDLEPQGSRAGLADWASRLDKAQLECATQRCTFFVLEQCKNFRLVSHEAASRLNAGEEGIRG